MAAPTGFVVCNEARVGPLVTRYSGETGESIWRRGWDSNPNLALIARNLLILLGDVTDLGDEREGVCTILYNLFAGAKVQILRLS